jgi:fatty acid desaturase
MSFDHRDPGARPHAPTDPPRTRRHASAALPSDPASDPPGDLAVAGAAAAMAEEGIWQPARPWPSWVIAVMVYALFGALTYWHAALPLWLLLPLGGVTIAWHGSLQHEAVHGHLGTAPWWNWPIALPPLSLWLPFPIYYRTHRAHHRFEILTEPWRDPESFYVDQAGWAHLPRPLQALLRLHNTLLGRLLLGPFLVIGQFFYSEVRALRDGDRRNLAAWLWHLPAVALVLFWVMAVAAMPLWLYLVAFVLPGTSLTLVRSFAEHKAAHTPLERTAVVEAGAFFSLLFLNNNLHYAHHRRPDLPWYALPGYYRRHRGALLQENGGLCYRGGYREIARRFLLQQVDEPVHPFL